MIVIVYGSFLAKKAEITGFFVDLAGKNKKKPPPKPIYTPFIPSFKSYVLEFILSIIEY